MFATLVLFVAFYSLALRYRKKRELHKRFILLASTGGMGAAGFRVLAQLLGPGFMAGAAGILLPNVIIVAAMILEARRGQGVHPVFTWGLAVTVAVEVGVIFTTPMWPGAVLSDALAGLGRGLAPLY